MNRKTLKTGTGLKLKLEKYWKEGRANEGDSRQVGRENQVAEERKKTGGKTKKGTHSENTYKNTHTMTTN